MNNIDVLYTGGHGEPSYDYSFEELHKVDKSKNMQILEVFKLHLKHVVFDKAFFNNVMKFRLGWVHKSLEHMDFLGSNLVGVNKVVFSALDEEMFFLDLLKVDYDDLKYDIYSLKDIDVNRKVSSNIMLLTLTYLMHGFTNSSLPMKEKEQAIKEVYYIFAYKVLGSLISHYFTYQVDKSLAVAVHEKLNDKFLIKKLNTWNDVLEYRAQDVLQPNGLHAKRIKLYKETEDATRVVIDLQGRLRDMIKNIYLVILDVRDNNNKIVSTTLNETDTEGDETLKSIVDRPDMYITYIKNTVYKHNDFIKADLVHVVSNLLDMGTDKDLYDTLTYMSESYLTKNKDIDFIIDKSIDLSIDYLSRNNINNEYDKNLNKILIMLRNYYAGSRVNNKDVEKLKNMVRKIFIEATNKTNKTKVSNNRVGIIVYIFLRAIVKNRS